MFLHAAKVWYDNRERLYENQGRFLSDKEVLNFLSPSHKGLVVNGKDMRMDRETSYRNTLVVANTGAGKTSSLIIPNVLSIDNASMVITDPSGAILKSTGHDLEKRGYRIVVLDPAHTDQSDGYNPLMRATTIPEIQNMAHVLVGNSGGGSDPFWEKSAVSIVGVLLACLRNHPEYKKYANLSNLLYLLNNFGDGMPLAEFVTKNVPNQMLFDTFKGFISQSDRTMQGIISQAKSSLSWLQDPDLAKMTANHTFRLSDLRKEKVALFLKVPQNLIGYYAPFLNLIYTQIFHTLLDDDLFDPKDYPVYCLLDEFGHMRIPEFEAIITTTRARNVSLTIIIQALSQLEAKYGRYSAQTIQSGGCASQMFFGGMHPSTAKELRTILGDITISTMGLDGKFQTKKEPLMSETAISTMPKGQMIFMHSSIRPMKIDLCPYFTQPNMLSRTQKAYLAKGKTLTGVQYLPL